MKMFLEKLSKLIEVKKIVTIILTVVFCVLSITGTIDADKFQNIFVIVISFYFGQSTVRSVSK